MGVIVKLKVESLKFIVMNKINKIFAAGMVCCSIAAALTSCSKDDERIPNVTEAQCATGISFVIPAELQKLIYVDGSNTAVLPLVKGETAQLGATLEPDNVTYPNILWTSSYENIASVNDGLITALSGEGMGYTIISATPVGMYSGANVNVSLKVKVDESLVAAEKLNLTTTAKYVEHQGKSYPSVYQGEDITISCDIEPEIATYRTCSWTSSDESVATVENGVVKAVVNPAVTERKVVTITANTYDNSGVTASIDVVVRPVVNPEQVTIDTKFSKENFSCVYYDRSVVLTYATYPEDCTTSTITWTSSNEEIATVDKGVVTFNKNGKFGEFTITATCPNGQSNSITMNMPAGLMRELFHDENNLTWQATTNGTWTWSDGKITITTPSSSYKRQDLKHNGTIYICTYNYPLYAIKIDDVVDQGYKSRSFKFDLNGTDIKGNTYSGMGNANNAYNTCYKCSDGSRVFVYDFVNGRYQIPAEEGNVFTSTVQGIKYADIKDASGSDPTSPVTYNMYWAQSFKTLEDIEAYLTSEGLTFEKQ